MNEWMMMAVHQSLAKIKAHMLLSFQPHAKNYNPAFRRMQ
jgi:hypothetical protein